MQTRIGVLLSGRGSNLGALLAATADAAFPGEIVLVLSDNPDAGGLARARAAGVEARAIDRRAFPNDRAGHEAALDAALSEAGVEFVCLAGYMRRLTPFLVQRWQGRMINIHPSLLPAFPGLDTHARALAAGVALHGCSVHLVTEGVDEGPILGQAAVPVLADDDPARLAARVLRAEHALYPAVLGMMLGGAWVPAAPEGCLLSLLPPARRRA
jgi:phosphoribosylglycinamide formyltransferase-1